MAVDLAMASYADAEGGLWPNCDIRISLTAKGCLRITIGQGEPVGDPGVYPLGTVLALRLNDAECLCNLLRSTIESAKTVVG